MKVNSLKGIERTFLILSLSLFVNEAVIGVIGPMEIMFTHVLLIT